MTTAADEMITEFRKKNQNAPRVNAWLKFSVVNSLNSSRSSGERKSAVELNEAASSISGGRIE